MLGLRTQSASKEGMTDDTSELRRGTPGPLETGELPPIERDPSTPVFRRRVRPVRLTIKLILIVAVIYFLVIPLIPDLRDAVTDLNQVQPIFLDRRRRAAVRGVVLLRPC